LRCEGQLIPIQQNTALFSILGTTYGGNGTTNFALPDLRQKVALGFGQGLGLSQYQLGQTGGQQTGTLTTNNMPSHSHTAPIKVSSANATTSTPTTTSSLAVAKQVVNNVDRTVLKYDTSTTNTAIGTMKTSTTGNANPTSINTVQPVTASLYCIAVQGIYPPRN
jgi:microcystin-dependent protein